MNSLRPTTHAALALAAITFAAASTTQSGRADMIDLAPTTDFNVLNPTINPSIVNDGTLRVTQEPGLSVATTYRSVLKFDISSIPGGSTINSADLVIDITNIDASTRIIQVIGFTSADGDANSSDGDAQGSLLKTFSASSTGEMVISLTQTFLQPLFDADDFLVIRLQGDPLGSGTVDIEMLAEEDASTTSPRLQVNFSPAAVPEPASTTLLGLMAIAGGFTGWRRSRRTSR